MNLYLIGYRGCGKSTVAPLVAEAVGWTFIDTDQEITTLTGQSIKETFERDGQTVFREWESTVIQAVAMRSNTVISLGGGAILAESNRQTLQDTGWVVWLQASAAVLHHRIQGDSSSKASRPQLTDLGSLTEIKQVLNERQNFYAACADYTVEVDELNPIEVADLIVNRWQSVDK